MKKHEISYNNIFKYSRTIEELKKMNNSSKSRNKNMLKEWRNVRTLLNDKHFKTMLFYLDMNTEEFSAALNPKEINEKIDWEKIFPNILEEFSYNAANYNIPEYVITNPFLEYATKNISLLIASCSNIVINEKIKEKMEQSIQKELFFISGKVLALEFNSFKESNPDLQDSYFEKYIKMNFSTLNGYITFFLKYPTLARILTIRTQYLMKFFEVILLRIDKDKNELINFLGIKSDNLILSDIDLSNGDSHNQGKSVCTLHFEHGTIVYKPKNLQINRGIQKFSDWFTNNNNLKNIKFPEGIYKEKYSYIEYIHFKKNRDIQEVENYYIRYGYLIALTYILNITDIHLENLIAHGEYPVIIDIETSFQNKTPLEDSLPIRLLNITDFNSIKSSGLLPKSLEIKDQEETIELAALNGKQKKLNTKAIIPIRPSKDEFHYSKIGELLGPSGKNIPKNINNKEIDYRQFQNLIIEGFSQFINKVFLDKENVIKKLEHFNQYKVRALLKSTERYFSMVKFSNHPNYNKEMKYRERLFMNIWSYPYLDKRPVISEVRHLLFNDIPFFETFVDSKDLLDSTGIIYKDYFEESGLQRTIKKIRGLNHKEIALQKSILLTTLGIANKHLNNKLPLIELQKNLSFEIYKNSYISDADIISDKAIIYENQASFITLEPNKDLEWSVTSTNESLYDGLSGIALMYLFVYIDSKNAKYLDLYKKTIKTSIDYAQSKPILNAFQGYLSPMYPIILEIKYLGSSDFENYLEDAIVTLKNSQDKLLSYEKYDFISGCAGTLTLLSALYKMYKSETLLLKFIDSLSVSLLKNMNDEKILKKFDTVGIAHGVSGIVLSLVKANRISTKDIIKLLSYEDKIRMPENDKHKWCKGITGKLQARLQIIKYKKELYKEIDIEWPSLME